MRKLLTEQDNCYTPKYLVDYFGHFDYDPATTKAQAEVEDLLILLDKGEKYEEKE